MSFKYPISNNITSYLETTASGIGSFQWCISELKFRMCWASSQFHALKGPPDGPDPESWEVFVHSIHCCSCSITLKSKTHLFCDGWTFSLEYSLEKEIISHCGGGADVKQKIFLRWTIIFVNENSLSLFFPAPSHIFSIASFYDQSLTSERLLLLQLIETWSISCLHWLNRVGKLS